MRAQVGGKADDENAKYERRVEPRDVEGLAQDLKRHDPPAAAKGTPFCQQGGARLMHFSLASLGQQDLLLDQRRLKFGIEPGLGFRKVDEGRTETLPLSREIFSLLAAERRHGELLLDLRQPYLLRRQRALAGAALKDQGCCRSLSSDQKTAVLLTDE